MKRQVFLVFLFTVFLGSCDVDLLPTIWINFQNNTSYSITEIEVYKVQNGSYAGHLYYFQDMAPHENLSEGISLIWNDVESGDLLMLKYTINGSSEFERLFYATGDSEEWTVTIEDDGVVVTQN